MIDDRDINGLPAVAWRDKIESNPILAWPMLALGLNRDTQHWDLGTVSARKQAAD